MMWKVRMLEPLFMRCFVTAVLFLLSKTSGNTYDREHQRQGTSPGNGLRINVMEGEQTSLPCPVEVVSRRAISAIWYHFSAAGQTKYSDPSSQTANIYQEAKQVYALVAPATSPTPVLAGSVGLVDGAHWKQPQWVGRAFFSLLSDPPALLLNRLERTDTGNYACNVTYQDDDDNGTSNVTVTEALVELLVAVPLPPPVIVDHEGTALSHIAGPYAEGDILRLTCVAPPANHKVTLQWRRNGRPLNRPTATLQSPDGGFESTLDIGQLFREHLFSNITCVAASDTSAPVERTVLLDMFPPTEVVLWNWPRGKNDASGRVTVAASATAVPANGFASPTKLPTLVSALTAEAPETAASSDLSTAAGPSITSYRDDLNASFRSPSSFECDVKGSRPHANVTWFVDGRQLDDSLSYSRTDGNVTTSVLLLPASENPGSQLECRATNSYLPEDRGVVHRYLAMDTSNKPEVNIKLGTGLNASHISEGADMYMECSVATTSGVVDVTWSKDGRELGAEPAEGTVVTSHYLVIRRVGPRHSGSYTCTVTRSGGEKVESKPLHIRVRYSPRCDGLEEHTMPVEKYAALNVTCNVQADPSDGLRYFWMSENDTETSTALSDRGQLSRVKQLRRPLVTDSARLEIIVNASVLDSIFACWAENAVGAQKRRCRFKFVDRSDRSSGLKCSVGNITDTSFSLTCWRRLVNDTKTTTSWQNQRLRVEVLDGGKGNRSERSFWSRGMGPMFITRLRPATDYLVVVRMPPDATFHTYVRTLGPAQTVIGQGDPKTTTQRRAWTLILSVVSLACGLLVTLVILVSAYCACAHRRRRRKPRRPPDKIDDAVRMCTTEKLQHAVDNNLYYSSIAIS